MNKTINANIGGMVFTLDEDAYNRLQGYLTTLKNYFIKTEGTDEILEDIEARIAEMLQERLDERPIVQLADIDGVIETMGMPEDFEDPAAGEETSSGKSSYTFQATSKRFFRNPDDKVIAGVCSGLASYFNLDPIWVRIAFVLFGLAFFGTGLFLYVILWIIVPEANTTAEKLQMRGEKVTISNIEKAVREEVEKAGNRIQEMADNVSQAGKRASANVRGGTSNFFSQLGRGLGSIVAFGARLFAIIMTVVLVIILISFFLGIFGTSTALTVSLPFLYDVVFETQIDAILGTIGLALIVVLPIFWLLTRLLLSVMKARPNHRYLNLSFLSGWLGAVILVTIIGARVGLDFRAVSMDTQETTLQAFSADTLYVDVRTEGDLPYDAEYIEHYGTDWLEVELPDMDAGNDGMRLGNIELRTSEAKDSVGKVFVYRLARGSNAAEARERAEAISYNVSQEDSVLYLPRFYYFSDEPWRHQQVKLVVKVPKGKEIKLSDAVDHLRRGHHYRVHFDVD